MFFHFNIINIIVCVSFVVVVDVVVIVIFIWSIFLGHLQQTKIRCNEKGVRTVRAMRL